MRVLMVSWEFPPVLVGGLGRHVDALSRELAAAGHDVVVVSRQPAGTDARTHPTTLDAVNGLRVLRVAEDPPLLEFPRDLVGWTLGWQHAAVRAVLTRLRDWTPEAVHAHDWLAAHAAITFADVAEAPLVATVHATEAGRGGGRLDSSLQQQVHSVEWWLAHRADALIVCSAAMHEEVTALFGPALPPLHVIHNGIAPRDWAVDPAGAAAARARWAPGGGTLLVHFGRLEHEKGVGDLVAAMPAIRAAHPGARLLLVGTGSRRDALAAQIGALGLTEAVALAGYLPDADLAAAVAAADAVVLPSRYEPFGIVALEAAAAGAPLVVARSGGLAEVVVDGETGLSFPPGDVAALAGAVGRVLDDPAAARSRAARARARLATDFDWTDVAARTAAVHRTVRRRPPVALGRPVVPVDPGLPGQAARLNRASAASG